MSSWGKKKRKNLSHCDRLFLYLFYIIWFLPFNKETDKRPRNQRNHHKRILFCSFWIHLGNSLAWLVSTPGIHWKVMGLIPGWETRFHKLCDAGKKRKKTLKFLEQLFWLFYFCFAFLEFVVRVTEKEDKQKVTETLCGQVWHYWDYWRELMARYIKPRTKTQVNNVKNSRCQKVKNLVVLLL